MITTDPLRARRPVGLRLAAAVIAVTLGLGGCGAAPSLEEPTPGPTTSSLSPAPGTTLADLGFTHGPAGFTVPTGVTITRRVDQPNVITVLFPPRDGPRVLDHLVKALPSVGFVITSQGGDSLIFDNPSWEGAFTISSEIAGLTLRRKP